MSASGPAGLPASSAALGSGLCDASASSAMSLARAPMVNSAGAGSPARNDRLRATRAPSCPSSRTSSTCARGRPRALACLSESRSARTAPARLLLATSLSAAAVAASPTGRTVPSASRTGRTRASVPLSAPARICQGAVGDGRHGAEHGRVDVGRTEPRGQRRRLGRGDRAGVQHDRVRPQRVPDLVEDLRAGRAVKEGEQDDIGVRHGVAGLVGHRDRVHRPARSRPAGHLPAQAQQACRDGGTHPAQAKDCDRAR